MFKHFFDFDKKRIDVLKFLHFTLLRSTYYLNYT